MWLPASSVRFLMIEVWITGRCNRAEMMSWSLRRAAERKVERLYERRLCCWHASQAYLAGERSKEETTAKERGGRPEGAEGGFVTLKI